MTKFILLVKRKPGTTHEAFRAHYECVHAPLAMDKLAPWLVGYSRTYLTPAAGRPELPYDCVTELHFRDRSAMEAAFAWARSDEGQVLARDEANFMERAALTGAPGETIASAF